MSLTGILLDVSGSMKQNIRSRTDKEGGPWARSIFKVVDDLIEHDASSDNWIFALGVGADNRCSQEIFDVIGTVQKIANEEMSHYSNNTLATEEHIEKVLRILETNGARNIRHWAKVDTIQEVVSDYMASLILNGLESDKQFVRKFVQEILPQACRDTIPTPPHIACMLITLGTILFLAFDFLGLKTALVIIGILRVENAISWGVSRQRPAKKEDIIKVVEKAKYCFLKDVGTHSIFSVQDACRIIRGCVDEKELSVKRSRELLKHVESFIFGSTPLYQALDRARWLFEQSDADTKLLFVLSDGEPKDAINQACLEMKDSGVKVVSCFITRSTDVQPKRLYDKMPADWEPGAKLMFSLSSTLATELLPRAILAKRGWTIDVENNETKLFVQVNHPDNLKEACDMASSVVYCQDALADLLSSVDLDIYINQSKGGFKARNQVGKTCYANASVTVVHLAMKRILGREGGYPNFEELRNEIIQTYGSNGANTRRVLQEICPKYRLHCRKVDAKNAMKAIVQKRPVVARFRLTDKEWDDFLVFYHNNPTGILTKKEINVERRPLGHTVLPHAVVLTSYNSKCLILMNSFGSDWADNGFFRVENSEVLQLKFYDVYWTSSDLTDGEKAYYKKHGPEVAKKLMESLKGLQKAEYKCPKCNAVSSVTEFSGTLSEVECPKCLMKFSAFDNEGNILALNMYLSTLVR